MTPQEVKLWIYLRSWRSRGYHFRRQAPRENYILDFVCLRKRLIIELDGGQHNFDGHANRDKRRDSNLAQSGFKVLRFWNNEIDTNLIGVLGDNRSGAPRKRPPPGRLRRPPSPFGGGIRKMT